MPKTKFLIATILIAVLVPVLSPQNTRSEEPASDEQAIERAARLAVMQRSIAEYSLTIGALAKPVELRKIPVLRFTNPIRGAADGGLFLWEHEGRPVALACIYRSTDNIRWDHEFQTLSDLQITAIRANRIAWQPPASARFKVVPKVAPPSEPVAARRREAGEISRRFSVRLLGWGDVNRKNDELRLQDNPVHRWGDPNGPVVDGRMFLFGEATDPELALLLEAHRDGAKFVWKYAVARVTSAELSVRFDDQEVVAIPVWDHDPRPDQPYLTVFSQPEPATN